MRQPNRKRWHKINKIEYKLQWNGMYTAFIAPELAFGCVCLAMHDNKCEDSILRFSIKCSMSRYLEIPFYSRNSRRWFISTHSEREANRIKWIEVKWSIFAAHRGDHGGETVYSNEVVIIFANASRPHSHTIFPFCVLDIPDLEEEEKTNLSGGF